MRGQDIFYLVVNSLDLMNCGLRASVEHLP